MKIVLAMLMVSYLASAGPYMYSRQDNDLSGGVDYIIWTLRSSVMTDEDVEIFDALLTHEGIIRCVGYDAQKRRQVVFGRVSTTINETLWSAAKTLTTTVSAQKRPAPGRKIRNTLQIIHSGSRWMHCDFSADENIAEFVQNLRNAILKMDTIEQESLSSSELKTIKKLRRLGLD